MRLDKCPHCNTTHIDSHHETTIQYSAIPGNEVENWRLVRCNNPTCVKLILVMLGKDNVVLGIYPYSSAELDANIVKDEQIRDDFKEASICLSASCYKASMVMSRRLLQRCLKEQGYKERILPQAIDHAIADGVLRKPLQELAKEIKEYGNFGAHPDDDQLDNIGKEEATTILGFSRLLIEEFYEIPAAADKLRKKRELPGNA